MEYLNWIAEHPVLTFFVVVGVANGLGKLGTSTTVIKHVDRDED